jgi:hypothetical protein
VITLYCHACSRPHTFTRKESERIIYALQAALADSDARSTPIGESDAYQNLVCLRWPLNWSHDIEAYSEITEGHRELRILMSRELRQSPTEESKNRGTE